MSARPDTPPHFERLSPMHISRIQVIENEAYPDPWTFNMFRQELENQTSYFCVLIVNDAIAGYGGFWHVIDEVHITKVTVAQPFRGLGYGRSLMNHLIERGLHLDAAFARLEVREANQVAQELYRSLGFQAVGLRKGYYAKTNESAVVMVKDLKPRME
ncbi:MAG: ribosomal protein S18-alanine N-acetyltransferase [Candidatus Hydrogenedentes bacterium]|nr:ribosomal protein S18-alanine N-acetyltransferase [Candidatus Hydrogenedentota bacterium]